MADLKRPQNRTERDQYCQVPTVAAILAQGLNWLLVDITAALSTVYDRVHTIQYASHHRPTFRATGLDGSVPIAERRPARRAAFAEPSRRAQWGPDGTIMRRMNTAQVVRRSSAYIGRAGREDTQEVEPLATVSSLPACTRSIICRLILGRHRRRT